MYVPAVIGAMSLIIPLLTTEISKSDFAGRLMNEIT